MTDLFSLPGKWRALQPKASPGESWVIDKHASELESALQPVRELVEAAKEAERVMTHMERALSLRVDPPALDKLRTALSTLGDTK